jgi:hypothetical protein
MTRPAVDDDFPWHEAGVAEVVLPVVARVDQVRLDRRAAAGNPAAVADHDGAFPRAPVIAAKAEQRPAVQRGVLDRQRAAADGVQPRMAQRASTNRIRAGDALVRVHAGERAVLQEDVLAEIRPNHSPAGGVADVVHPDPDHREVDHLVCAQVVGAHAHRLAGGAEGLVRFVAGDETVAQRDIGAAADREEAAVRMADVGLADDVMGQPHYSGVRAGDGDVPRPVVVSVFLFHSVGDGGEHPALEDQRSLIDREGFDARDGVVIPVDGALDGAVAAQDEAIALGRAAVLVETPPDVDPLAVVLHPHPAVAGRLHLEVPLVPGEPLD